MGRVIARPFAGDPEHGFTRTANRHDFSLEPPAGTLLDRVKAAGMEVIAVGKITDIFAAVSYTHRDVYKRQANRRAARRPVFRPRGADCLEVRPALPER